jgi:hypothetical protein
MTTPAQRLELFIELYVDGIPAKEAWVKAGYTAESSYNANAKLRENWKYLEKIIDSRIGSHVPRALAVVVDVMENATSAQTRLQAAKDLLDRAGKKAPQNINISHKDTDQMADTDIDAEIIELTKKIGLNT